MIKGYDKLSPVKPCSKCKEMKKREDFFPDERRTSGLFSACRKCYSMDRKTDEQSKGIENHRLLYRYGITIEDYDRMLGDQDGVCKICKNTTKPKFSNNKNKLSVDHCHSTGKVRGLLCSTCNLILGEIERRNDDVIDNMFEYLKECKRIKNG